MRATRILLVLLLLTALTSTVQAQVLPRRRLGNKIAEFGVQVMTDAFTQGINKAFDELGDVLVLQLALQFYAQAEMDPQVRQLYQRGGQADTPSQNYICLLLAESAKLAEKLKDEKFSPPVLEKMYMQYAGIDSTQAAVKESPWSSRPIYMGEQPKKGEPPPNRPSVTIVERHLPFDPRSKAPQSVHCSFVFRTTKDGENLRKTVDFDMILDKQKKEGPTSPSEWKLNNVQYDRPLPDEKRK